MKSYSLFTCLFLLLFMNCSKSTSHLPSCLNDKIISFSKSSSCVDASVKEFNFQSSSVYVFDPGTCGADMTSEVVNTECKTLGFLGGISGNFNIKGENFSKAVFIKDIWKK